MRGIKAVISQSLKLKRAQTSEPQPRSQGSLLPIPTNVRLPFTHSTKKMGTTRSLRPYGT